MKDGRHDLKYISFFLNRNENRLKFGFSVCVATAMRLVPFIRGEWERWWWWWWGGAAVMWYKLHC